MSDEGAVMAAVKQGRNALNKALFEFSSKTNETAEPFVSRVRPLAKQIVYSVNRFPEVRDKYPSLIIGTAAFVTSIPVLIRRGRIAGVATGIAGALFAAGGLKLSEIAGALFAAGGLKLSEIAGALFAAG
eukprot:CAMPEP_0118640220 /NCGR_PEP_ID=MMETSP0785-20121206/4636_1 /TAXON_ID=91992 /ORGANISM="Bolidomonas pacifica, Strain CCMP 1866" /LENGTH=129 /DNA_ID=CAMNT_0006531591 /DNA_START=171 /DNA_END=557 /DNA_ORIENTATION=-